MKLLHATSLLLYLGIGVCSAANGRRDDIISCLQSSNIETISPSSSSYKTAIRPLNSRTPWFPAAVAIPNSDSQVSSAVKCASSHSLKVQALAGGHSYAAYGLGGQNGSLVINMKNFRDLTFDANTNVAAIGSGKRLGDVALGLYANGKRDIPHGVCGGVGLGGHATHGGFGFTSRMWGTTLDTVVGMDVVLADGSIKYVDNNTDPDLFWALRGAGDGFGIVTKFHVQTLLAPEVGTVFNFTFPGIKTAEERSSIFTAVQNFSITAPAKFHMRVFSIPARSFFPQDNFVVSGVYWGPKSTYLELIEPLASQMPNTTKHLNQELDYLTALSSFDQWAPLKQSEPYTYPSTAFFTKSVISPDPLNQASIKSFFDFITSARATTQSSVYWYVIHDLYGGVHSRIGEFDLNSASYAGRDALWTMQLYSQSASFGNYPESGFQFMQDMVDSIQKPQPETSFSAYPNYVDPSLKKEEALRLYYGPQLERLKRIKRNVDKGDLFWNPQSVSVGKPSRK